MQYGQNEHEGSIARTAGGIKKPTQMRRLYITKNYFTTMLYSKVSKSFVGFCHTVCIFFFLNSSTFTFTSSYYFVG